MTEYIAEAPTFVDSEPTITGPAGIVSVAREWEASEQEHLIVILMDTRHHVLHSYELYRGTVNECSGKVGEVYREAIRRNAAALAVVHNHPGNSVEPSAQDTDFTRQLIKAADLLGFTFLDHVIIAPNHTYKSLRASFSSLWEETYR